MQHPPPGQKGSPAIPDEGPVVGAQLAQVVKELRTHYAAGITACASRLGDQLQGREATSVRRILSQAAPPRQELIRLLGVPNTQQVCGRSAVLVQQLSFLQCQQPNTVDVKLRSAPHNTVRRIW
jgi:hypothetical protein